MLITIKMSRTSVLFAIKELPTALKQMNLLNVIDAISFYTANVMIHLCMVILLRDLFGSVLNAKYAKNAIKVQMKRIYSFVKCVTSQSTLTA